MPAPDQVYATIGGITFGDIDEFGVDWSLVTLDGWGATKPTLTITQKPRQAGGWAGRNQSGPRAMSMSGMIFAPTADLLRDAFDRLGQALSLDVTPLVVTEAGFARTVLVQRSDEVTEDWEMPTIGTWSTGVMSADWRKFGTPVSDVTTLPSTTGGLVFGTASAGGDQSFLTPDQLSAAANAQGYMVSPSGDSGLYDLFTSGGVPVSLDFMDIPTASSAAVSFPLSFNAKVVSGQVNLTNVGNEQGPLVLRVDGPCSGPVITHVSSGAALVFASSLVLGAGEFLLIDTEARTVLANGQASRSGYITSRGWFGFDPGNNTFAFTAASYDAASQLTVTATPAWK